MSKRTNRSLKRIIAGISPSKLKEIYIALRVFCDPIPQIMLYLGITQLPSSRIVKLRGGCKIQIDTPDDLISIWGCWIRQDYPVWGNEKVIIDAGANIGAFSLFAANKNRNANILAIEPVSGTFEKLQHNVRVNLLDSRITWTKVGVAANDGEQIIYLGNAGTYSSSYQAQTDRTETIKTKSLQHIIEDFADGNEIDLLKMDCEGAEMDALLGANTDTLRCCKRIVIEYHTFSGFSITDVTSHLVAAGFYNKNIEHFQGLDCGLAHYIRNT